jgi:hypothetical protein
MRGSDERTGELFSYVDLEKRVPAKHPLRLVRSVLVRSVVNEVLAAVDSDFSKAYADSGRPSIPPAAGASAASVLYDPVGASADGAARLQPALPLVRRAWDG